MRRRWLPVLLCCLVWESTSIHAQAGDNGDWTEVWAAVQQWKLEGAKGDPHKARELAVGRGDSLRSALLGALVSGASSSGASGSRALEREFEILAADGPWPLTAGESWSAAEALQAGSVRSRVLIHAMQQSSGSWSSEQIRLAYKLGVEAAEDLRLEQAILIQQPLHEQARAEWSAFNLALSLRRTGLYQRADRVLEEQIEAGATADLYSQRALNALGAGNEKRSRNFFGAALARGSLDAAVVLARLDLAAGRPEAARAGFRALLVAENPGAWALRGWGIAQIQSRLPASPGGDPAPVP